MLTRMLNRMLTRMLTMLNVNNNLLPSFLIIHHLMFPYKTHPIFCDDIHYIDSQPFEVAKDIKFNICAQINHLIVHSYI